MAERKNNNTQPQNMQLPKGGGGAGQGLKAAIRGAEKPRDFKTTFKKMLSYLGSYKIIIIIVMIMAAFSSLFKAFTPKLLGSATDVLYKAAENSILSGEFVLDYIELLNIIKILFFLAVMSYVFSLMQGFIMAEIANSFTYKLRKEISEKINKLPLNYFDKTQTGDILSRITNDVDTITNSIREVMTQLAIAITLIFTTVTIMLSISIEMTMIAFIIMPVSMLSIGKIVKISQPLYKKQQRSLGELNSHIEEMLSSHTVVKAFNMEEKSINQFNIYNEELKTNAFKSQIATHLMMPVTNLISNSGYIAVCVIGASFATAGRLTVGNILSFIEYVKGFNQPIQQLASISTMMQSSMACAERVFEFLESKEEVEETKKQINTKEFKGEVSFNNVSFGYKKDKKVIENFSLVVNPGEKIAIVGPTGAGKTTIVKLLMRYYELDSGDISIDGVKITNLKRDELRNMFGMVLQDTWLFKGSIRDNILYSNKSATKEEMINAAKISQVHNFVKTLPKNYEFELNEETSNISQGQKQLITIARAFLQNPKMLILDEATSSVDTRTEVLIQKAMQKLMENRTSFIIAHRLSTIRDADKIIVMKDGKIIEFGAHNELIKNGGFYKELYKSQFENVQEE